jgi:hypothetical protein
MRTSFRAITGAGAMLVVARAADLVSVGTT